MAKSPRVHHWNGSLDDVFVHPFNPRGSSTAVSFKCTHDTDAGLVEDFSLDISVEGLIDLRNKITRALDTALQQEMGVEKGSF